MPAAEATTSGERFIDTTLQLIAEEGGSLTVNLRAISRRMGCAHTNVYNYFGSYGDLRWAAFRRALRRYGEHLTHDLDRDLDAAAYLDRVIANLASFPQQHPGLYRFIGSDPIDLETIPADILTTVTAMKEWLVAVVEAAAGPATDPAAARQAADILLAYVDGETLNLINGRAVPGEDLEGRVVANAVRLFDALIGAGPGRGPGAPPPDPASIFGA
jgi:AcrR family transcriptional regulator